MRTLFAFTRTHLEAKWGTTGAVHCIHADKIEDHINNYRAPQTIPSADLPRPISAAKALKETIAVKEDPKS